MHRFWKKIAAAGFLVFLALWIVGLARGFSAEYPEPSSWEILSSSDAEPMSRVTVANNYKAIAAEQTSLPSMLDPLLVNKIEVHEKNAQITAGSTSFASDEPLGCV